MAPRYGCVSCGELIGSRGKGGGWTRCMKHMSSCCPAVFEIRSPGFRLRPRCTLGHVLCEVPGHEGRSVSASTSVVALAARVPMRKSEKGGASENWSRDAGAIRPKARARPAAIALAGGDKDGGYSGSGRPGPSNRKEAKTMAPQYGCISCGELISMGGQIGWTKCRAHMSSCCPAVFKNYGLQLRRLCTLGHRLCAVPGLGLGHEAGSDPASESKAARIPSRKKDEASENRSGDAGSARARSCPATVEPSADNVDDDLVIERESSAWDCLEERFLNGARDGNYLDLTDNGAKGGRVLSVHDAARTLMAIRWRGEAPGETGTELGAT